MRYLLVRGVEGTLVPDPHVDANPRRYAGRQFAPAASAERYQDRFELCEQVIADAASLRAEIAAGNLVLLAECVAKTHADASAAMAPPAVLKPSLKAKKDGDL